MYSDDPIEDFRRFEDEKYHEELELRHCSYCFEPIYEGIYYNVEGQIYCPSCIEGFKETEE